MAGHDKTEKATPKKRADARKKGQVARSADINGAFVLMAALMALSAFGPRMVERMQESMRETLALISTPRVVEGTGLGALLSASAETIALAVAPIACVCAVAGVVASVGQVGFKPSATPLKPELKKLNPIAGAKKLFGVQVIFESIKSVAKVGTVAVIAGFALIPNLPEVASLVGLPAEEMLPLLAQKILSIAQRAGAAYLVIAAIDYIWQRYQHEKQLKMDKQEVKDEAKQQNSPPEVRAAIRQRQRAAARARMMAAVPEADVVVTNPTHYAVALKYDGSSHEAPQVIAKGKDLLARRIREIAAENDVPVVSDPPLARSLHASVEVGHQIPEQLYQAVAQLLAFVYRTASRRKAAA